jgi:hypothetical protein
MQLSQAALRLPEVARAIASLTPKELQETLAVMHQGLKGPAFKQAVRQLPWGAQQVVRCCKTARVMSLSRQPPSAVCTAK